ncbi:SAUR-like auxin-responsive protein family [Raphanus sativus]|uniref:Auxin-induced protein 6B n=1 Tax=Raphanus sativus TaxID=3726 RepID=A0A6J0N6T5_RAPSA|nr:auxin-induced protein 6B [Raphanus sativus]KAJ4916217.1 SAUR-like auxin-responsive protein family [Raphanus sativus]
MAGSLGKCSKIRHIVRLRQMLRRWRNKARLSSSVSRCVPSDVPSGHVAVCVGSERRRFVVRASYLNHPILSNLLVQAEEEYGFVNQGPLVIPCEDSVFEEAIRFISRSDSSRSNRFTCPEDIQKCHGGVKSKLDLLIESHPLLHYGVAEKAVW